VADGKTRFRALSRAWSEGPSAFISDLGNLGFKLQTPSEAQLKHLSAHWSAIHEPSSVDGTASQYAYTYARKLPANALAWGLILLEGKESSDDLPANTLCLAENAEAAMDFILQKCSSPEWAGRSLDTPEEVHAEDNVVVGPHCEFGRGVVLESGVRLGARVKIGNHTRVGAHTVIGDDCEIGNYCRIKAHAAIGGQGFGLIRYPKDNYPRVRRHVGRVVVEDHVQIGSFVAIDRGVFEDTRIGRGSCVDNLVQIAHNSKLGANNVLCGLVGLSGSTVLGNNVTLGGLVGTKGHLSVGDNSMIAGQSGITTDLPANSKVKGYPPRPLQEALRVEVLIGKLPELYDRIKALEKALKK
jgi:UDP-3-O-[3-hydroxymyristoyl] glucosamine N-acyltransferase